MKNKSFFPVRYQMVGGTFMLALIVLFDRVLISVAKDPVSETLDLSDNEMGWVLAIFALGYALFQTPAGMMADKFGARKTLTIVVSLWSIFTAMTGAAFNFISMLIIRFLFGAGEAGAFPGMARAIYKWIPIGERGLVNGINFSGGRIGAAIALPIVAWLIEVTSWQQSFLILGILGILWALAWYFWFCDNPEDHFAMSNEEVAHIKATTQQEDTTEEKQKISFSKMFKSKNMGLLMAQYFCSNFTFFFALTWLFPHIKSTYNLDVVEAGFYSSAPLIFGAFGNWFSGWLVDRIYKTGKWSLSRKVPAIIGFSLAAIGIFGSIYMTEINGAIIFISMAVFGADMTLSPSWSTCVDIGKEHSGAVSGTMNMAGNLGSFLTALAFPYLVSFTGSVTPFFILAAVLNTLAILFWMNIKSDTVLNINK
ncbi:MFS transporter [Maribacter sp. 2210JD10-5]|uniref:MFS transporter n=1 Tax=Maribacter sp. 2210JD10-5 TaxID=3386272 RepID=UPI0039BCCE74